MKEQLKLKGIVSARDSKTGKVIFENLQNTIVLGGCISALAKLAGVASMDDDIFIDDSIPSPLGLGNVLETPITGYNFTCSVPTERPVRVSKEYDEAQATTVENEKRVFSTPKPVGFFDGTETYDVADIPTGARAKKIIALKNGDLSFIRYKLPLLNSSNQANLPVIEDTNRGANGITYVNSIELFSSSAEANMLFSKLTFPAIPFFGNLSIDFEYRIYL